MGIKLSPRGIDVLLEVADRGGRKTWVRINSSDLGKALGISQQSASRILLELTGKGLLERKGSLLHLTDEGEGLLYARYLQYQKVFSEEKHLITLRGRVTSGLGEGGYYMSLEGYISQFISEMGFRPYPGTLNIKLSMDDAPKVHALKYMPGTVIKGFSEHGRTFGDVTAYPARIRDLPCVIIFPARGHYTETIEVISPDFLRKKLSLKDGDEVEVSVLIP